MRKAEKEQVNDFITLLGQAHGEIRKTLQKQDAESALPLLGSCQDGAMALGELIEKSEGEGFRTVSLLEDYCELLYRVHERLSQGEDVSANKVFKTLRQQLVKISNSVSNDITVRREVVFLPYKASMWDSLESVWRAADAAPDCDAYVIPIPYYDKNPDGSFRKEHYEGNQYPKDVPVTFYKDYDFEERRPDVIFIHNPYDDQNYITSVHPDFYSGKLKGYTDKLVYIPYFFLREFDPKDTNAAKSIEKFCLTYGVVNADKVIVQSEAMRQIYIDILSGHTGEDTRKMWSEKILGLGSPKLDKALYTRREELEIPGEWLSIIRKADGSWKKIVFYSTSVASFLKHNEKMLEKMRAVFERFKEYTEEIAFLWRPHPLMETTISCMRPQLWSAYEELVKEYRREGWGIYDDTADVDRAVILCDAYYGDPGSVAEICLQIEKTVLIQGM